MVVTSLSVFLCVLQHRILFIFKLKFLSPKTHVPKMSASLHPCMFLQVITGNFPKNQFEQMPMPILHIVFKYDFVSNWILYYCPFPEMYRLKQMFSAKWHYLNLKRRTMILKSNTKWKQYRKCIAEMLAYCQHIL